MAKINTLVFAGGAIHNWKGCSEEIVKALSQRDEFEITTVEDDLDALVSPNLDPYDLIVFYYTVGEISGCTEERLAKLCRIRKRLCRHTFSCRFFPWVSRISFNGRWILYYTSTLS